MAKKNKPEPEWNDMCPVGEHGLDYQEQDCGECAKKPLLTNELVVKARIAYALKVIEQAQNKLEEACRATSPIIGFAPECLIIGNMSRKVKDLWYKIDNNDRQKHSKLKLDREPDERYDAVYLKALP